MTDLAKLAGTKQLKGAVTLTNAQTGASVTYEDQAQAQAAVPTGATVEHRRGAFFVTAAKPAPKKKASSKKKPASSDGGE